MSTVKETRTRQGLNKGHDQGKQGGRITGAHDRHKQRQSNVLRHKTTKETLNKDNTDKAARAEP